MFLKSNNEYMEEIYKKKYFKYKKKYLDLKNFEMIGGNSFILVDPETDIQLKDETKPYKVVNQSPDILAVGDFISKKIDRDTSIGGKIKSIKDDEITVEDIKGRETKYTLDQFNETFPEDNYDYPQPRMIKDLYPGNKAIADSILGNSPPTHKVNEGDLVLVMENSDYPTNAHLRLAKVKFQ